MGRSTESVLRIFALCVLICSNAFVDVGFGFNGKDERRSMILDVLIGEPVTNEYLVEDLKTADIIFLGEYHTIHRHHLYQKQLINSLLASGVRLAVGMEMFQVNQQPALDQWMSSQMDVGHLKYLLGTYWNNIDDYKEILLMLRDQEIPLVALNAQDSLVKAVASKGIDGITEQQRRLIPEGARDINPDNARLLSMKLRVHKAFQHKGLDRIILAQALRDQTMAKTIAAFKGSEAGKERKMVVIAGSGHINYGFGIPERTERLMNDAATRIVLPTESGELVLSEEEKRQSAPIEIKHSDLKFINRPIADYLIVRPLKEPEKSDPSDIPGLTAAIGH